MQLPTAPHNNDLNFLEGRLDPAVIKHCGADQCLKTLMDRNGDATFATRQLKVSGPAA